MIQRDLLGSDEARSLQVYPGNRPWLSLVWAMAEVQAQTATGAPPLEAERTHDERSLSVALHQQKLLHRFRKLAEQMRWHYGQIVNGRKIQVPFPYFHLLQVLIAFNLLMISYATVPLASWPLSLLANVLCAVTVLGMRTVAIMLSDPFGKDKCGLPVNPTRRPALAF